MIADTQYAFPPAARAVQAYIEGAPIATAPGLRLDGLLGPRQFGVMLKPCLAVLSLIASPALAVCPALPDRAQERAELLQSLSQADTYAKGRVAVGDVWMFWRTAPDEIAQEMLVEGIEAIRYGDLVKATRVLTDLVTYCPEYAEGYNQLAFSYFLQEQNDKAEALLMQALSLEPAHFGALSGLGLIYLRTDRAALAQIYLRKGVAINPWLNERNLLKVAPKGDDL